MRIEEAILDKVCRLPPDKQQQVLGFADFLTAKVSAGQPRRSLYGLWADLNVSISEEDIAEARREMWGNFPLEDR